MVIEKECAVLVKIACIRLAFIAHRAILEVNQLQQTFAKAEIPYSARDVAAFVHCCK